GEKKRTLGLVPGQGAEDAFAAFGKFVAGEDKGDLPLAPRATNNAPVLKFGCLRLRRHRPGNNSQHEKQSEIVSLLHSGLLFNSFSPNHARCHLRNVPTKISSRRGPANVTSRQSRGLSVVLAAMTQLARRWASGNIRGRRMERKQATCNLQLVSRILPDVSGAAEV